MSDNGSDDDRWTIRGITRAARMRAIEAAGRRQMPVGTWLAHAIEHEIEAERRPLKLAPAVVSDKRPDMSDHAGELAHLLPLMQAAAAAAAASGRPMSRRVASRLYGLVDDNVRRAAGMPPRVRRAPPRVPPGQPLLPGGAIDDKPTSQ